MRAPTAVQIVTVAACIVACGSLPEDPEETLDRVRGGVLRAGAVHAPPWIVVAPGSVTGREADLVEGLARSLDARVEWHPGGSTERLEALVQIELDLVAGGFTDRDPWRERVAVSKPHHESGSGRRTRRQVLFLPPGENRWLLTVDRFVGERLAPPARDRVHAPD